MAEKKWWKSNVNNDTFEKKVEQAKESMSDVAGKVWEQSKKFAWRITNRWWTASTEEKICMILWIICLLIWLCGLGEYILWILFVILWLLLVMGFFNKSKK